MIRLNSVIATLILCSAATSSALASADESNPTDESVEQYLYHPKHEQKNFDADVDPLHENSLQGFDCMDQDKNGYLIEQEIKQRADCVDNAEDRGMGLSKRALVILDLLDADRDRRVSKREFNVWNEMQRQQHEIKLGD
ncbi:hypothetical protein [Marinobacter alexandrii]|jgi:hypothetical protein|uniref:hypothetical protein n=1 Tax=Marinobacter alexandrii TaxID=2570351 RepID=UPI002ABDCAE4|nr:hypothetical protein [Marinobacter alexandrii]